MTVRTMPYLLHPGDGTLDGFARGSLKEHQRARVAAHLQHCGRCRRVIASERELLEEVKRAAWPEPGADVLERVLARRAAGQRVILPVDAPTRTSATTLRPLSAVLVASLLIAVMMTIVSRSHDVFAGDTVGVLHLVPDHPRLGGHIAAEYEPPSTFAGERRLILRARVRKPADEPYASIGRYLSIPLERGRTGYFRAEFTLPDSVVYAAFVVEDTSGRRIDTRNDRLWELLTSEDNQRPSYTALEQQENAWLGRNWESAYAAARRAAQLYPDDPASWRALWFYQQLVLSPAALDSVRPLHRARLTKFQQRLSSQPRVAGSTMGTMYFYSRSLQDTASASYWDARLQREAPSDPFTVQIRVIEISREWKRDSTHALERYETLWNDVAGSPGALVHQGRVLPRLGFDAAWRLRDTSAMRRWARRELVATPDDSLNVAGQLVQVPALRDTALGWIRRSIAGAAHNDEARRPLWRARAEHERQTSLRYGAILGRYGETLLSLGRFRNAADTLDLAASIGWRPSLMRSAVAAHLGLGDTLTALRLLAGVSVDPVTPDSTLSWIEGMVSNVPRATWQQWKDSAATRMRREVLSEGTNKSIREEVGLRASDGTKTTLAHLRLDRKAVVVFWSAHCGPALEAIPQIERLIARLSSSRTPVIVVTQDSLTTDDLTLLRSKGGSFSVYQDVGHDAQRAFSNFGTPAAYVLDAAGRIRFTWVDLEQIPRQLAVLESK
jgi:hypothetical protein